MTINNYNWINECIQSSNKICPYCKSASMQITEKNFSYECLNSCLIIYLDWNQEEWYQFSIYLNSSYPYTCLSVSKSQFYLGIALYIKNGKTIYLPHFNVFDYSISELNQKIKQYLVFV